MRCQLAGHKAKEEIPLTAATVGANDYVECQNCGFVLATDSSVEMTPKHWDSCPDCDGTDFGLVDN